MPNPQANQRNQSSRAKHQAQQRLSRHWQQRLQLEVALSLRTIFGGGDDDSALKPYIAADPFVALSIGADALAGEERSQIVDHGLGVFAVESLAPISEVLEQVATIRAHK